MRAVGIIPVTPYKVIVRCGLAGRTFWASCRAVSIDRSASRI